MAFEQKELSGALFRNKRKTKSDHPEYTGQAKIDGIEYWVSAWLKETSSGEKYMSLAYTPKDIQTVTHAGNPPNKTNRANDSFDDDDSDIPF